MCSRARARKWEGRREGGIAEGGGGGACAGNRGEREKGRRGRREGGKGMGWREEAGGLQAGELVAGWGGGEEAKGLTEWQVGVGVRSFFFCGRIRGRFQAWPFTEQCKAL